MRGVLVARVLVAGVRRVGRAASLLGGRAASPVMVGAMLVGRAARAGRGLFGWCCLRSWRPGLWW